MDYQHVIDRRRKTETVSKLLKDRLVDHLTTLSPLLAPDGLYGRSGGSKIERTEQMENNLDDLRKCYRELNAKMLGIPEQFDPAWLAGIAPRIELHAFEYVHPLANAARKMVTITSPVRWVVSYPSSHTATSFRSVIENKGERRPDQVLQFVVNNLVLDRVLAARSGVKRLLNDLRYTIEIAPLSPAFRLPLITVASCLPSTRPPDDVIATATEFSGVPAFIELIEEDAVNSMADPLKSAVSQLLK